MLAELVYFTGSIVLFSKLDPSHFLHALGPGSPGIATLVLSVQTVLPALEAGKTVSYQLSAQISVKHNATARAMDVMLHVVTRL